MIGIYNTGWFDEDSLPTYPIFATISPPIFKLVCR